MPQYGRSGQGKKDRQRPRVDVGRRTDDIMTTKLYWHDSRLTQFSAQVIECFVQDGHHVVVLDQSAFYPGGGGQPCDMGVLNAARVMAVAMAEDGRMLHHLEGDVPCRAGETVTGAID